MRRNIGSLNKNFQFARAYRSKCSFVSPFVVTYIVKHRYGGIKTGITASKKIGCAVERNRARRVVKAASRELLDGAAGNYDIVFVCRKAILAKKSTEIKKIIAKHLVAAGVIKGPPRLENNHG